MKLRRILILTSRFFGVLLLFAVLYFIAAFVLSNIPINSDFTQCEKDCIEIYILTNGVHTDLVLPIRNRYKEWSALIPVGHNNNNDLQMNYIAFGWGDKNFYLETPLWADLKFSTAFNALFLPSTSAMHVTFYKQMSEKEYSKKIRISTEQYKNMVQYIEDSFQKNNEGEYILIKNLSYGSDDCFYEAKGIFNLFYTCNTWTNEGLKQSGLRASLWTPFESTILGHYNDKCESYAMPGLLHVDANTGL